MPVRVIASSPLVRRADHPDDIKSKTGTQDQQIPTVSVRLYPSFITIFPSSIERHPLPQLYDSGSYS